MFSAVFVQVIQTVVSAYASRLAKIC